MEKEGKTTSVVRHITITNESGRKNKLLTDTAQFQMKVEKMKNNFAVRHSINSDAGGRKHKLLAQSDTAHLPMWWKKIKYARNVGGRNKQLVVMAVMLLFLFSFAQPALAAGLSVEKHLENDNLQTGDDAKVLLTFANPYGKEIPVRIRDKNVFGNNGIDVQCLEYTLPADKKVTLAFNPTTMYSAGTFTLGKAEINYTDPETGKEKTIFSNELSVTVKDSGKTKGTAQGITTIYKCGGVNMQSTSFSSSGGSTSFSFNMGGQNNFAQNQQNPSQNSQDRVQNNQMNQNMNSVKKEIQKQAQEQQKMHDELKNSIAKNPEFLKKHSELAQKGYNITDAQINPESADTGNFKIKYKNQNGDEAEISGRMENGTMKWMNSLTQEEKQDMLKKLEQNPDFRRFEEELRKNGYNRTDTSFTQKGNKTEIKMKYQNTEGKKAEIKADYENKTIENVSETETKKNEEKEDEKYQTIFWTLLAIVIATIAGYLLYRKYGGKRRNEAIPTKAVVLKKRIDWRRKARKMLDEAEKLFAEGKEKDAYEKVSQAVRLYLARQSGFEGELTAKELIRYLRKERKDWKRPKECLDMCAMVEFAKYKPNKKDFDRIMKIGREIVR